MCVFIFEQYNASYVFMSTSWINYPVRADTLFSHLTTVILLVYGQLLRCCKPKLVHWLSESCQTDWIIFVNIHSSDSLGLAEMVTETASSPGPFRNAQMSKAAQTHKLRKLRAPSKCRECDSLVVFHGAECEEVQSTLLRVIICHMFMLENIKVLVQFSSFSHLF